MESARSGRPEEGWGYRRREGRGAGGRSGLKLHARRTEKQRRTKEMASPDIDHEQMEPERVQQML